MNLRISSLFMLLALGFVFGCGADSSGETPQAAAHAVVKPKISLTQTFATVADCKVPCAEINCSIDSGTCMGDCDAAFAAN